MKSCSCYALNKKCCKNCGCKKKKCKNKGLIKKKTKKGAKATEGDKIMLDCEEEEVVSSALPALQVSRAHLKRSYNQTITNH
jgi:hypothetical protein